MTPMTYQPPSDDAIREIVDWQIDNMFRRGRPAVCRRMIEVIPPETMDHKPSYAYVDEEMASARWPRPHEHDDIVHCGEIIISEENMYLFTMDDADIDWGRRAQIDMANLPTVNSILNELWAKICS